MFVIIRDNDGVTEILKESSTQSDKTFTDYYAADLLVQQLNQNVIPSKNWSVSEKLH
ncbi:Transposase [Sporosarcina sp. ANT_H38]